MRPAIEAGLMAQKVYTRQLPVPAALCISLDPASKSVKSKVTL